MVQRGVKLSKAGKRETKESIKGQFEGGASGSECGCECVRSPQTAEKRLNDKI